MSPKLNLTPYSKLNSKWIIDLNIKCKTIKLLEENIGGNLHDLEIVKEFSDLTLKAQFIILKT